MPHTLIKGGSVITMDPKLNDLSEGDVLLDGDKIAAVGNNLSAPDDADVIDANGMIVIPGLINGHIHTWQTGLRGLSGDWTMHQYLRAMHAGLATFFRPEDIRIANLMGALNQIDCGSTMLVDWHHNNPTPEHTDAAIDGLEESGIRALFLHGSAKPDPKSGQKHFSEIPMPKAEVARLRKGRLASNDRLVTMGLAILGPQIGTHAVCMKDQELAHEFDLVTSMHHSGAKMTAPRAYKSWAKKGWISQKTNVVHGNLLSDELLKLLVDNGATLTVTAEIEMQMGFGEPLMRRLRDLGSSYSVGSDVECAIATDLFAIMRQTLQAERHFENMATLKQDKALPETLTTSKDALRWVTTEGARLANMEDKVGSLTPGKQADVVLIRATDLNLYPVANPIHSVVMHANPGNVDSVFIAGKAMKRDGKLLVDGITQKQEELGRSAKRILTDFGFYDNQSAA